MNSIAFHVTRVIDVKNVVPIGVTLRRGRQLFTLFDHPVWDTLSFPAQQATAKDRDRRDLGIVPG